MILDEETPCELQYVGVPLLSQDVCRKSELGLTYQDAIGRDLPDVQLCAGHLEGGKDACQVLPNFIKNPKNFRLYTKNLISSLFLTRPCQFIIELFLATG